MVADFRQRCVMPSPADLNVHISIDGDPHSPEGLSEAVISSLAQHILAEEGKSGVWQFGIQFVDDPTMQHAHDQFMGIDSPTDIMTFPYEDDPMDYEIPGLEDGEMIQQGGDLMISMDRAADHARDARWSTRKELEFLIVHGILHILGWDDESDDDRSRMLERQSILLESGSRN